MQEYASHKLTTISKAFTFHAAHRIPHHDGACKQLHGHTYSVEVTARGPIQTSGSAAGMVLDFGDLKEAYGNEIHSICDHAYLNDVFDFHTTAENLANHFLEILHEILPPVFMVGVWETPTSYAVAELNVYPVEA